jgi:hypothetical protein
MTDLYLPILCVLYTYIHEGQAEEYEYTLDEMIHDVKETQDSN